MVQAVGYSTSEEMKLESEQETEIEGVDPWKAAMQGDLDALLQYIDDGGDVNQRDRDNNTPLHWACQESHFDIVGVLMSRHAAVDPVNDLQSTPLHYACREGNLDIVTGLINFNANLEARNKDNLSPLHVAAGMGHIEVTKSLLKNKADMEAEDNALYTPLWRAAYYGHPEVVEVLLAKGANKLARNKKGRKPGDVFSPSVEHDKKERIKDMLGMGAEDEREAAVVTKAPVGTMSGASKAGSSSVTGTSGDDNRTYAGDSGNGRSLAANTPLESGAIGAPPPPAYKERTPSAVSLAESYNFPGPSPANSPSSVLLHSNATVLSETVDAAAERESAAAKSGGILNAGGRVGNGEVRGARPSRTDGGSLSVSDPTSQSAAGVQTTPSVNGSAEITHLKSELARKNQQLEQVNLKLEEYKDSLLKAQTNNTRELDDADIQAEQMNRRVEQLEDELENKKEETITLRKELEYAERNSKNLAEQLQGEQKQEKSKGGGCGCTIS